MLDGCLIVGREGGREEGGRERGHTHAKCVIIYCEGEDNRKKEQKKKKEELKRRKGSVEGEWQRR